MLEINIRALVPIAMGAVSSVALELSNKDIAWRLAEHLLFSGYRERVEAIVRCTACEEGFDDLTYDAFVRRIERALEEAGFEVVKRNEQGREMYAYAQAGMYTDMEIQVFGPGQSVTVFHAHKCVVSSASPFLMAMIEQRRTNRIGSDGPYDAYEIREIHVDVFRVCMEFMYTKEVRIDVPMESDLVAGLVLAADRFCIAGGLLPLIGRELVNETNAPLAIEAAVYMNHETNAVRGLIDICAAYVVRSLARNGDGPMRSPAIHLPMCAIYAIAGAFVDQHLAQFPESRDPAEEREIEKWTMSVGTALLACTGTEPRDLQVRLISTGTPTNEHASNYRATFATIDTTNAPVSLGRTEMSSVADDGKHTLVFCVGQREYVVCVRKSKDSKTVGIKVAFRSSEPAWAPQLVTIRAAGSSAHTLLACGYEHTLEVPFSDLDSSGIMSVDVEADPLFAICSEVIRLTVQQGGTRSVAVVAGLDTRVLQWIFGSETRIVSYESMLREVANRPSEDDRVALTKALVSGFGNNGVIMGEITEILSSLPCLFESGNEGMLEMLVNYSLGLTGDESVRDQMVSLIRCMSQDIRASKAMRTG
jgi:hypothetical protein